MNYEVGPPIYLFKVGEEFTTMVRPFEANLTAQVMKFKAQLECYLPLCVSHEVSGCILSSLPFSNVSLDSFSVSISLSRFSNPHFHSFGP